MGRPASLYIRGETKMLLLFIEGLSCNFHSFAHFLYFFLFMGGFVWLCLALALAFFFLFFFFLFCFLFSFFSVFFLFYCGD